MPEKQEQIPYKVYGESDQIIHFAHANGFPPEAYEQFLSPFQKDYQIIASKFRPLWGKEDPKDLKRWHQFADDMISFLDQQGLKNIIGMGHSLGGVSSLIAAMKRPDLFSKLILLDPVIFNTFNVWLVKLLPLSVRKKIIPIAKIALNRRDRWASQEEAYQWWRSKKVFQKIPDSVLQDLVRHVVVPDGQGKMILAYSKIWEAQVYMTVPFIFQKVKQVKTPMIVVKGEHSNVITSKVWTDWQQAQAANHFINFKDAGHLLPLEYPEALAQDILNVLSSQRVS